MARILITGSSGQLAKDCSLAFKHNNEIITLPKKTLDITSLANSEGVIKAVRPDYIINCAAFTQVDKCEMEQNKAFVNNVTGVQNLCTAIKMYGGKLIHISSDYVFDGEKETPYTELDETNPINYYGFTKLQSEKVIPTILNEQDYIIVRTSWTYSFGGSNFLKTIYLKREKPLQIVNDQIGCPTWTYALAKQLELMIQSNCNGLYHATSQGYCSWYDFANYFFELLNVKANITPCSTEEYNLPAKRPKFSALENARLIEEGINIMSSWKSQLEMFISEYQKLISDVWDY